MVRLVNKARTCAVHGAGKVRRWFNHTTRPDHVDRRLRRRRGECVRCGACCKLLFKCPLLVERPDGSTACRIHGNRPGNCRVFPMDENDLADRDRLLPELPCGYYFVEADDAPPTEAAAAD